jgi:ClpP class serine protease
MLDEFVKKIEALEAAALSVSAQIIESRSKTPQRASIKRGVATISIKGPLVKKRSAMLDYFGVEHTAYEDIADQTTSAVSDGAKKIVYNIDSPGGDIEGILIGMDAIKNAGVPTEVLADEYLASAAYMLASQADSIIANNELTLVGSVGVATYGYVSKSIKDITNTDSKDKRPDLSTDKGVAVVERELDDIYQILAERIAAGRNVSVDDVKNKYGNGAIMTARSALQKRMIDGVRSTNNQQTAGNSTAAKSNTGVRLMKIEELRAEFPGLYQEVLAQGKEAGAKEERDRVSAHLMLAEGSGDVEAAHKAIIAGEGITEMVKAQHMSAAMKRNMLSARKEDNPPKVPAAGDPPSVDGLEEQKTKAAFEAANPGWEVE